MPNKNSIHPDLVTTIDLLYRPHQFECLDIKMEPEGTEYGAYLFKLNNLNIRFRVAKTTPKKVGQFVTLWKRIEDGPIQPYDIADPTDFFVISTSQDGHFGQFIFPKAVLSKRGIISILGIGGKRAIRVYPPWKNNLNQQAQITQKWQSEYFLDIPSNGVIDISRAQELYSIV